MIFQHFYIFCCKTHFLAIVHFGSHLSIYDVLLRVLASEVSDKLLINEKKIIN